MSVCVYEKLCDLRQLLPLASSLFGCLRFLQKMVHHKDLAADLKKIHKYTPKNAKDTLKTTSQLLFYTQTLHTQLSPFSLIHLRQNMRISGHKLIGRDGNIRIGRVVVRGAEHLRAGGHHVGSVDPHDVVAGVEEGPAGGACFFFGVCVCM